MKYKLKLVKNVTLVIGQEIGSQNPLKNITSTIVATLMDKILEKNSSFLVKERTAGKVQFLFLRIFLLVLTKFY